MSLDTAAGAKRAGSPSPYNSSISKSRPSSAAQFSVVMQATLLDEEELHSSAKTSPTSTSGTLDEALAVIRKMSRPLALQRAA